MQYLLHLESPIGPLTLTEEDGALIRLDFGKKGQAGPETTLLAEAKKQLEQYFSGTLRSFTLPLRPEGTPFQQKVWAALLQIPWGETRTYGQVAAMIGQPKACRAVGMPWGVFSRAFVCLRFSKRPLPRVCGCGKVRKGFARKTGL